MSQRQLIAIMFTDLVGYTAMMQRDEALALSLLESHFSLLRPIIVAHHGIEVKTIGDAFMVEFPNALDSVNAAIAMQEALSGYNKTALEAEQQQLRIGIHLGDVERRDDDIFGDGVNIAARLEPLAHPGGICISASVHALIQNHIDTPFYPMGEQELKNISQPVVVFSSDPTQKNISTGTGEAWVVGVLDFRNLSPDPEQDFFAQAISLDITSGLTQSTTLSVLNASTALGLDNTMVDQINIGVAHGIHFLLQGTVRKSGNLLRVSAQLTDTSNGLQLWSKHYDHALTADNLFDVQDDIREQIVSSLGDYHGVIYASQTQANVNRPTESLTAYECLSVALAYDRYISPENHLRARESLERAVKIDPEYASAWAHLSWIYTDEYAYQMNMLPNSMQRATEAAQRSYQLAPNDYHVRWLLARVYYFSANLKMFLAEAEHSLSLNSDDGTTVGLLGMYIGLSGDFKRGQELMDRAIRLNPNFPSYYYVTNGIREFMAGNYDGSVEEFERMQLPDWPVGLLCIAACHVLRGDLASAQQQTAHLRAEDKDFGLDKAKTVLDVYLPFLPEVANKMLTEIQDAGLLN